MASIRSKFMAIPAAPALTTLFHNVWPVGLGAAVGDAMSQAAEWRYPWLAAIVTGALLQIMIHLMRSWFSERRDLLQTMKAMLEEQRNYWGDLVRAEKDERHQMANRAARAEMKLFALQCGVAPARIPEPPPLYPEVEQGGDRKTGT